MYTTMNIYLGVIFTVPSLKLSHKGEFLKHLFLGIKENCLERRIGSIGQNIEKRHSNRIWFLVKTQLRHKNTQFTSRIENCSPYVMVPLGIQHKSSQLPTVSSSLTIPCDIPHARITTLPHSNIDSIWFLHCSIKISSLNELLCIL